LNEEGLFCWFEHQGSGTQAPFGSHTLAIADHNHAFKPGPQPDILFRQPGAVMEEDSLDCWWIRTRERAGAVELASWDYRARMGRPVSAAGDGPADLIVREALGQYAWSTPEHGERIARNELLALNAQRERHLGAGTVRTLAPGAIFSVSGHDHLDELEVEARTFVALRVAHLMHNNFSAEIRDAIGERLEPGLLADLIEQDLGDPVHALGRQPGDRPLYRMRVEAMRSATAYRSGRFDERGQLRHPKPNVGGQQTAIVVGPEGSVVHTDRDHRVKLQFHWQRGQRSHSRLRHPAPAGDVGAPSDDSAGTWTRVVAPLGAIAGANWGSHAIPRVGQEVLVDFMDGDIDRPLVIGCLYNGRGEADAQHNRARYGAGAATGNAPAWFPGVGGAHAHPAVLSGVKTQAMAHSGDGGGAYSQLVFDASAGQPRVSLQRHAERHKGTDELNLGHLRHQVDNQRRDSVGFGAELKTAHSLAMRAAQGVLLSTYSTKGAGGMMDSREAQAQIEQAAQMQAKLADIAQQHKAALNEGRDQSAARPEKLAAVERLTHTAKVIAGTPSATSAQFTEPMLLLSSKAGIAATAQKNVVLHAGNTSNLSAGHDINTIAAGNSSHLVATGISLFTYGKAGSPDSPNQETGLRLHAASGKVSVQSQSDVARFTADKAITVASVTKTVSIAAKTHLMLTALGAAIKLEGGNITLQYPGTIEFKAGSKEFTGPKSNQTEEVTMPTPNTLAECPARLEAAGDGGASIV
jgi:uncharacterized protein involved in type VI secretion and phage assembly